MDAADHQGATALHVAAERGAIEVSWLLLQEAGLHVLHLQDNNRLTPVDLSRRGDTFRYIWQHVPHNGGTEHAHMCCVDAHCTMLSSSVSLQTPAAH